MIAPDSTVSFRTRFVSRRVVDSPLSFLTSWAEMYVRINAEGEVWYVSYESEHGGCDRGVT